MHSLIKLPNIFLSHLLNKSCWRHCSEPQIRDLSLGGVHFSWQKIKNVGSYISEPYDSEKHDDEGHMKEVLEGKGRGRGRGA